MTMENVVVTTSNVSRFSWDEWGMILARAVAERADCTRRQVGAVIMDPDHNIVATGYNGAASGVTGCIAGGCPRATSDVEPGSSYDTGAGTCIALHAEQNALLRASWGEMRFSTLYVTAVPCDGCWRMITGTLIARVVTPSWTQVRTPARSWVFDLSPDELQTHDYEGTEA